MTAIDFENATPELLKELERRRDKTFRKYQRLNEQCHALITVLGLDNPENLTHMLTTADFFELAEDDNQPEFCEKYSANPKATEQEYSTKLKLEKEVELGRFEGEGGKVA